MKRHIRITRDEPIPLTKRTRLTPKQLQKIAGAGNGEECKYNEYGRQTLELTRRLAKARRKAQKFVLFNDYYGRRLYIADREKVKLRPEEEAITFNIKEALTFFYGFDDPERKIGFYNKTTKFIWQSKRA
jgi:hypothetical protein